MQIQIQFIHEKSWKLPVMQPLSCAVMENPYMSQTRLGSSPKPNSYGRRKNKTKNQNSEEIGAYQTPVAYVCEVIQEYVKGDI